MPYRRRKSFIPLLIGVAFGLFAISHLMTLLDMAKTLETPLIAIRALAYLTVIFALYKYSVQTQTDRNWKARHEILYGRLLGCCSERTCDKGALTCDFVARARFGGGWSRVLSTDQHVYRIPERKNWRVLLECAWLRCVQAWKWLVSIRPYNSWQQHLSPWTMGGCRQTPRVARCHRLWPKQKYRSLLAFVDNQW